MIWVNLKRIIKSGFISFWRNGVVSLAAVLVMTVTLFFIGGVIFISATTDTFLEMIEDKVDINVYFKEDATEEDMLSLIEKVKSLHEVELVTYISKEEALELYRERHTDDYAELQALELLDENPFRASIGIKAYVPSQYESIAKFLEEQNALSSEEKESSIIDKINFFQNQTVIERLSKIIRGVEQFNFVAVIFLIIISIIITFNTIRLTTYIYREEISVMRLVGAENRYIRGPFVVEGIMYGFISATIALIGFYPLTMWLGRMTETFFGGVNLFEYYISNFVEIFAIIMVTGIVLGSVSSYLAVRRYLKT